MYWYRRQLDASRSLQYVADAHHGRTARPQHLQYTRHCTATCGLASLSLPFLAIFAPNSRCLLWSALTPTSWLAFNLPHHPAIQRFDKPARPASVLICAAVAPARMRELPFVQSKKEPSACWCREYFGQDPQPNFARTPAGSTF